LNKKLDWEKDCVSLPYYNLMLEVTRKCNLTCEHCMRGEPQNIDMSDEILEKVFSQVKQIYHLSLTGGEPFLAPDVIEKMVDIIIKKKIHVVRCTTVNNGTILNDLGIRCIKALNRLADYIYNSVWDEEARNNPKESQPVSISISNSVYHKNDVEKAIGFYKSYSSQYVNVDDQGNWETGLKDKHGNVIKNKEIKSMGWLKKEGRAKENNLKNAKYMTGAYMVDVLSMGEENGAYIDSGIQVCANGNVVLEEPLSFETMDRVNMGNILKEPISCMIYKWNWMEPLRRNEVAEYCSNMTTLENPNISDGRRAELEMRNTYLDLKKYVHVEVHKDYPYLSRTDAAVGAMAVLALILCQELKDIEPGATEQKIIDLVIEDEFTDEGSVKFTKNDLKKIIDILADKNYKKAVQEMSIMDYIKYMLKLKSKEKKYFANIKGCVYEK